MLKFVFALLIALTSLSLPSFADNEGDDFPEPTEADFQAINQALQSSDGLVAEVHGPNVIAWRAKDNFFLFANLPMTGRNEAAKQAILSVHRHDKIRIKGEFDSFLPAGQRHIDVDSLELVKKFEAGYPNIPPYQYKVNIPGDLKDKSEIIVKVHAVSEDATTLVVEYIDRIIPVIAPNPDVIKALGLLKGDKIKIRFSLSDYPKDHPHIVLDKGPDALQVLLPVHSVEQRNENEITCGPLVLFVESPVIDFNVFAMDVPIGDGYSWTFTLLNPEDDKIYAVQRAKMQEFWDANVATIQRGRNYYVNPKIEVCAKGKGNDSSRIQANPQIFVMNLEDLTLRLQD